MLHFITNLLFAAVSLFIKGAVSLVVLSLGLFVLFLGFAFETPKPVKKVVKAPEPLLITSKIERIRKQIAAIQTDKDEWNARVAISLLQIDYLDDPGIEEEVEDLKNELQAHVNVLCVQRWQMAG